MNVIKAAHQTDLQLLEGIKIGDRKVIIQVYDLVLPSVIQWVKENNGTEEDARDVFQESMISVFRRLESSSFTLTCTLKSYLRIVCRNLWLSKLKNKNNQTTPLETADEVILDQDIESQIEKSEKTQLYFKHFDELGENCKKIMKWFFGKIPLKKIAERLDTSESYIKKRKFMCKKKLIEAIQRDPVFKELNA